jgi:hypothetical protein
MYRLKAVMMIANWIRTNYLNQLEHYLHMWLLCRDLYTTISIHRNWAVVSSPSLWHGVVQEYNDTHPKDFFWIDDYYDHIKFENTNDKSWSDRKTHHGDWGKENIIQDPDRTDYLLCVYLKCLSTFLWYSTVVFPWCGTTRKTTHWIDQDLSTWK